MTDRVFVDTNVWVYAVDHADPVKQARARKVLDPANGSQIVTSAQVLGEFYVTVTRKLTRPVDPADAARMVERMRALPVVEIDADRVAAAIDGRRTWQLAYWDALIIVAAQAAGCARVLSEDLATGATYGAVRVENPLAPTRRMAEAQVSYGTTRHAWDDADLALELAKYEEAGRAAGMRPNALHSYWDYARRFLAWRTGEYRPRGAAGEDRPVPQGPVGADQLAEQARAYAGAIERAGREPATVSTYHRHAMFFVRWLRGEFRPGGRLR
jgi:predicted nucleic acid-binding protein